MEEVETVVEALPEALREPAEALPLVFEMRPSPEILEPDLEPDILGLFVGPTWAEEGSNAWPQPSQIFLFLANIWEFVEGSTRQYKHEVRTTYLHELGHYLGLDEDDLFERGMD